MLRYQFYPTLLNEFRRYQRAATPEAAQMLLDRINRVPIKDPVLLKKFKAGTKFEDAVLKNVPHQYKPELVEEAQAWLPQRRHVQQFVQFIYRDIRFYGFADVVGEGRIIDIKTTSIYKPGFHALNFQNLYLYGLREAGFRRMEYLICDFSKLYTETYEIDAYDFQPLLQEMEDFAAFVEAHKDQITDQKILVEPPPDNLLAQA